MRHPGSRCGSAIRLPGSRPCALLWIAAALPVFLGLIALSLSKPAAAVPSFADQTSQPCQSCHVGGFGPHLTPFGREFKLNGYTLRAKPFNVPLAAMVIASFTHTRRDQTEPPDRFKPNNNLAFDQASLFAAGGVGRHLGGFVQLTYDGVARHVAWDNVDLRAVTTGRLLGNDAVFGLSLNNSPTVQDAWNTTPTWGFPFTDTAVSPTPDAAPLIDGALAQQTLGLTAYTWIGQKFYLEAGAYSSPSASTLRWLGSDPTDPGSIKGLAPYGRVAFQHALGGGTAEIGGFLLKAAIDPGRDRSSGQHDRYTDIGLDASWQRPLASGDILAINLRSVHERKDLRASCALGLLGEDIAANCARVHLNELRGDVSYTWRGKVGATLGLFRIRGSRNDLLYGPSGRPDSDGLTAQLDYTPWGAGNSPFGLLVNLRIGIQGTAYGKFNGARHDFDGAGANASDNDSVRIFTWLAF